MISFSVKRELARQRRANREEQRANHEKQKGEMAVSGEVAELRHFLPQIRGLVRIKPLDHKHQQPKGISTLLKQWK